MTVEKRLDKLNGMNRLKNISYECGEVFVLVSSSVYLPSEITCTVSLCDIRGEKLNPHEPVSTSHHALRDFSEWKRPYL